MHEFVNIPAQDTLAGIQFVNIPAHDALGMHRHVILGCCSWQAERQSVQHVSNAGSACWVFDECCSKIATRQPQSRGQ